MSTEEEKNKLGYFIGNDLEEDFIAFDLTEIQNVLLTLQNQDPIDLAHGELLQKQALRGADIIVEYLGKIIKTVGYLESKLNTVKNKAALDFKPTEGRATADQRKFAAEADPKVEEYSLKLAKAKASKVVLEKKYDLLIKLHHYHKDITMSMRRSVVGFRNTMENNETWG